MTTKERFDAALNEATQAGAAPDQAYGELYEVFRTVVDERPKVVVEIGAWNGGWLRVIARACPLDALLISIDPNHDRLKKTRTTYGIEAMGRHCELITLSSHDPKALERLKATEGFQPIGVLHIDGDHSYAGAKQDWDTYSAVLRDDGVVIFHDALNPSFNVVHLCHNLIENEKDSIARYQFVHDPAPDFRTGVCIIHTKG